MMGCAVRVAQPRSHGGYAGKIKPQTVHLCVDIIAQGYQKEGGECVREDR